jgi:hypothetical protein
MWKLNNFDINNVPESIVINQTEVEIPISSPTPNSTPKIRTVTLEEVVLFKNTDGGNMVFPDDISTANYNVLWKINTAGYVLKSTDGGKSWLELDKKLKEISAVSEQVAWGITFQGVTEVTTDGGKIWKEISMAFKQVSAVDALNVWATDKSDIRVKTESNDIAKWDIVFDKKFGINPPNKCYKLYGTVFSPQYSDDCKKKPKGGYVKFFNESGYVAKFTITYNFKGETIKTETGDMALGARKEVSILDAATNVRVKGEGSAVFSWTEIFNKTYSSPPNKCFKVYATIFDPKWNNNCD